MHRHNVCEILYFWECQVTFVVDVIRLADGSAEVAELIQFTSFLLDLPAVRRLAQVRTNKGSSHASPLSLPDILTTGERSQPSFLGQQNIVVGKAGSKLHQMLQKAARPDAQGKIAHVSVRSRIPQDRRRKAQLRRTSPESRPTLCKPQSVRPAVVAKLFVSAILLS
jgi:hypothetical protein